MICAVLISCEKDEQEGDPVPACRIILPADSAQFQAGEVIHFETEISGFSGEFKLIFSIDNVQIGETMSPPWEYFWDSEGAETGPHQIRAVVSQDGRNVFDEISIIIIDTIPPPMPPVPVIKVTPPQGTTDTIFIFDASGSYDPEDDPADLLFRWDFDGDGAWDTEYVSDQVFLHKYTHQNNYKVALEVMDSDSMTAATVRSLLVLSSGVMNACEGYVTVYYGGKVYKTVAIGEQCWLRENLDIGEMIPASEEQTDNDIIEKYCYEDDTNNCDVFGGLYTWDELMKYASFAGGRGICPNGWHIPTDEEWKELEGYADTEFAVGDDTWNNILYRGYDAGKHLKSLYAWTGGGNGDNLFDFKALPGGSWRVNYGFRGKGEEARFWTSTHDSGQNAFHRMLKNDRHEAYRDLNWETAAFSVRCIRD